jgi:hypothetical protein
MAALANSCFVVVQGMRSLPWTAIAVGLATMAMFSGAEPVLILTNAAGASLGPAGTASLLLSIVCVLGAVMAWSLALFARWTGRKSEPGSRYKAY